MKILNPCRFMKGGGGGSAPIPALVPPSDYKNAYRKSISVIQIIDALCEGPIYGLVDQFGKKVYGLDMLKGIYLNGTPVMNNAGEYNFRNILMEINLGTENQKPLPNFKNVEILKPASFKLLGPIRGKESDLRKDPNDGSLKDFTQWARTRGDWPSEDKDPFVFVHKVRNKDVTKLKVSLLVEALYDTVDQGESAGKSADMGMSKSTSVELMLKYGLENSNIYYSRPIVINGTATSPFAYMLGDGESNFESYSSSLTAAGGAAFDTSIQDPRTNIWSTTLDRFTNTVPDPDPEVMQGGF